MQQHDAARRAAILRGTTPPPLPDDLDEDETSHKRSRDDRGHDRKRRKLAGEDDTDMDIRLAKSVTAPAGDEDARVLKLRNSTSDAPLTDHTGHIDLFPVDMKEAIKREKNAELEKEKRRKERSFEDQYTMRFSNAAGSKGLDGPWYTSKQKASNENEDDVALLELSALENKNVWGNEDLLRKQREKSRMVSSDPLAFMQQAQHQLKKSKADKQKWAAERDKDLRELRAAQEREDRRDRHRKRKKREHEDDNDDHRHSETKRRSSKTDHHQSSRRDKHDRDRTHDKKGRSRSRSRDRSRHDRHQRSRNHGPNDHARR